MQKLILIVACCSLVWNYSIPKRYMQYEAGEPICGRRKIRQMFLKLVRVTGLKLAKALTSLSLLIAWFMLCGYFSLITISFKANGMKVVAVFAAVLATIVLWQDLSHVHHHFAEWCYNQEDNKIALVKGCWEIVLAVLVFINYFVVT